MIYFKYLKMHTKALATHQMSFMLTAFGQILYTIFAFLSIKFLFDRFGMIEGFKLTEVLISFSISYLVFSTAEFIFRGFDKFTDLISDGSFDRILTRPLPIIFQVFASDLEFGKLGRFVQALMVFIYAIIAGNFHFNMMQILALILAFICGVIVVGCINVLGASFSFITIQGVEVFNFLTSGMRELTQYPLAVYGREVLRFLTYVIPMSLATYYPYLYIIGKSDNILYALAPLASLLFIIPTYILWQMGVSKYKSVGS